MHDEPAAVLVLMPFDVQPQAEFRLHAFFKGAYICRLVRFRLCCRGLACGGW